MRDGQPLTIDGSNYFLSHTVNYRRNTTYENVLTINAAVSSIYRHTYTCTVVNALGSDLKILTASKIIVVCVYVHHNVHKAYTSSQLYIFKYFSEAPNQHLGVSIACCNTTIVIHVIPSSLQPRLLRSASLHLMGHQLQESPSLSPAL